MHSTPRQGTFSTFRCDAIIALQFVQYAHCMQSISILVCSNLIIILLEWNRRYVLSLTNYQIRLGQFLLDRVYLVNFLGILEFIFRY